MITYRHFQSGSTAIEFALVLILYLTFVLFVIDASRIAYLYNAGSETAMIGARYAVVCADKSDSAEAQVLARMRGLMPEISDIDLAWVDENNSPTCDVTNCAGVTIRIKGLSFKWVTPLLGAVVLPTDVLPEFATYLPRESMRQDSNSTPFCS